MTTSRQRELLDLKDRQCIEGEERERKSNLLLLSAQQLLKTEKEEVHMTVAVKCTVVNLYQIQRTLTHLVRGSITLRRTSCLTGLDSAALLMLKLN